MKNKIPDKFKNKEGPKRLNLGCGFKYKEGWINLDISNTDVYKNEVKVDVTHDLDVFPYPLPDNYFDEVLMDNVLEHLEKPSRVIEELERICKRNAIIKIIAPHFSGYKAYCDSTHKHYFSIESIDLMLRNRKVELVEAKLDISDNALIRIIGKFFTMFSVRIYERFLYGYFPVQGVLWTLKVTK